MQLWLFKFFSVNLSDTSWSTRWKSEKRTLPNKLINWWGGQLGPSRCLRIFPSQMKVPPSLSLFFLKTAVSHIRSGSPASGWWRAPPPQGTRDAWLSPWRSVYPLHVIRFLSDDHCITCRPSLGMSCLSVLISSRSLPSVFLSHSL